jgi:hypothetical protein
VPHPVSGTAVADLVAGEGTRKLVKPATARFTPNNKRVITAVLAGSAVGLLAAVATDHSLVAALVTGAVAGVGALVVLQRYQHSA